VEDWGTHGFLISLFENPWELSLPFKGRAGVGMGIRELAPAGLIMSGRILYSSAFESVVAQRAKKTGRTQGSPLRISVQVRSCIVVQGVNRAQPPSRRGRTSGMGFEGGTGRPLRGPLADRFRCAATNPYRGRPSPGYGPPRSALFRRIRRFSAPGSRRAPRPGYGRPR
jgi:hypothetical protein